MRVLLLGATGNVGSRMLPALVAYKHEVVLYVRTPSKLSEAAKSHAVAVVTGSANDSDSIKAAILEHNCDGVMNAAGLAPAFGTGTELPLIFNAVTKASMEAHEQRGGKPIRLWLMAGFSIMNLLDGKSMMLDYVPVYTTHKINYDHIRTIPKEKVAWSLFCAAVMKPRSDPVQNPQDLTINAENLVTGVDQPPEWANSWLWLPLLGPVLNVLTQFGSYEAFLEDCVDVMAKDFSVGLESQFIGHRVAVKNKSKPKTA